jgi:hypothetical protein
MIVHETIHHGDYRNMRTVHIEPTWAGFVSMLQSSPYPMGRDAENNRYAAMSFAKLLRTGRSEHGWARFEVTDWQDPEQERHYT